MSLLLRLALSFLIAAAMATSAQAGRRIALVIGNSAYTAVSPLANPKNDADLMATTLQSVGFEVTKIVDADQRTMKQAMLDFGRKLRDGVDASLFYYSGHGVQAKGENYLVPVDASIKDEGELDLEAIDVNAFLQVMDGSPSKVNIVILDACRNNPFASSLRSASRGLAMVDAPRGTYIAYSTAPGDVAADGSGANSPYTEALAKAIVKPGVKLEETFKEARRIVLAATDDKQVPWETTSLTGDFYFRPAPPSPPPSAPPPQPPKVGSLDSGGPTGTYEINQRRPGLDYKVLELSAVGDPRPCQQACLSDDHCRAWTYENPGVEKPNGRCRLKSGIPASTPSDCCTSGVKPAATPDAAAATKPVTAPPGPGIAADEAAWQKIAASTDSADFGRFLQAFPSSRFAADAGARQASLTADPQRQIADVPKAGENPPAEDGVFVLLSQWRTPAIALDKFREDQQRFPRFLGNRQPNLKEEPLAQGGIAYRIRVGPFPDMETAGSFCNRFRGAGGFCLVPASAQGDAPASPAGPIFSKGKIEVPQTYVFNLDVGAVTPQGRAGLWFEAATTNDLYLVPMNGAELAAGDRSPRDFKACAAETYSTGRISVRDLPVGSFVCVKTNGGRIGRIRIDALSPTSPRTLALNYVVWQ